jgi:hypothetical protein
MNGVGSTLESWIPEWIKIEKPVACDCEKLRDEMDELGPDAVEEQIEKFIEHFISQKQYLRKSLRVAPEWVMRGYVRLVIRRACDAVRTGVDSKVMKDNRKRKS